MKHLYFLSLCGLTTFVAASAADVKGLVMNTAADSPEAYATVRVFADGDSVKAVSLTTTDEQGRFKVSLPSADTYKVIVQAVGVTPYVATLDVGDDDVDMGIVPLVPSNELAEVVVRSQRPLIKREIDRLSYDVQADDESKTSTILDILRKVPMVSVDGQNNIRIKGQGGFKVYKNGRLNKAFTQNPSDIFQAIPASSIKRIEVITDPGAREDAEGGGLILNIVTNEDSVVKGITGTVSLSSSTARDGIPLPNLYLTSQVGKLMLSAYGGYVHNPPGNNRSSDESWGSYATTGNTLHTRSESSSRSNYGWGGLEASLDIDSLNLVTMEFGVSPNRSRTDSSSFTEVLDGDRTVYSYDNISSTPVSRSLYLNGSLNYQRSTRRKGETITLSYQISGSNGSAKSQSHYENMIDMPVAYTGVMSDSRSTFLEQTAQVDWIHPFNDHSKLDVGGKYIHRRNHALSDYDYIGLRSDHTDFEHVMQVGAVYADWRYSISKWNFRAGLRYEYTRLSADYPDGSQAGFGSDLHDVVPNAAVSWNINESNTIKASYGMNIQRPGIDYLNPAVVESPYMVSSGNPDLGSAHYNNVNLEYSLTKSNVYLEVNAGYTFLNNAVASVRTVNGDVVYNTYANIDHQRQAFMSAYMQWSPRDKMQVIASATVGYGKCSSPALGLSLARWTTWNMISVSQRLPWKLSLRGAVYYNEGYMSNVYQYSRPIHGENFDWDISLQRSLLKDDRLSVRVMWNRPFGRMKTAYRTVSVNSDYTGRRDAWYYRQTWVSLNVSYRFGTLNASVKKTAKSIQNDDPKGQPSGTAN